MVVGGVEHLVNLVTHEHVTRPSDVDSAPLRVVSRSSRQPKAVRVPTKAGIVRLDATGAELVQPAASPRRAPRRTRSPFKR